MSGIESLAFTGSGGLLPTIQLSPLQASLICAGACFARSVQVILRPCVRRQLGRGGISLDQHAAQIQLSKQLLLLRRSLRLEHSPLVGLPCVVSGLA